MEWQGGALENLVIVAMPKGEERFLSLVDARCLKQSHKANAGPGDSDPL